MSNNPQSHSGAPKVIGLLKRWSVEALENSAPVSFLTKRSCNATDEVREARLSISDVLVRQRLKKKVEMFRFAQHDRMGASTVQRLNASTLFSR
jgi:hypothetical protein